MGSDIREPHLLEAVLQAYAAGELDPAQRVAIETHLSACLDCRKNSQRVLAMRELFRANPPPGLDDLKWRRISQAVMSQLELDAVREVSSHRGQHRGLWLATVSALAVSVAVAMSLIEPTEIAPPEPVTVAIDVAKSPSTITSGSSPFNLSLGHGVSLHLSENAKLAVRSNLASEVDLDLELGQIDVRLAEPMATERPVIVQTPEFRAVAHATGFKIGYRDMESFVEVDEGEVSITGERVTGEQIVHSGERRTFPRMAAKIT